VNSYKWEMLSKASLKSSDKMQSAVFAISARAVASRTEAIASKTMLPHTPQCWLGRNRFHEQGRNRFAVIRAISVMSAFSKFNGL